MYNKKTDLFFYLSHKTVPIYLSKFYFTMLLYCQLLHWTWF